jgi:hypothetical protein
MTLWAIHQEIRFYTDLPFQLRRFPNFAEVCLSDSHTLPASLHFPEAHFLDDCFPEEIWGN